MANCVDDGHVFTSLPNCVMCGAEKPAAVVSELQKYYAPIEYLSVDIPIDLEGGSHDRVYLAEDVDSLIAALKQQHSDNMTIAAGAFKCAMDCKVSEVRQLEAQVAELQKQADLNHMVIGLLVTAKHVSMEQIDKAREIAGGLNDAAAGREG